MSNTNSVKPFFLDRLFGNKILLYIVALAAFAADVSAFAVALYSGLDGSYLVLPILFAVMDLLLLPVIYFSNFRFKYSIILPIVYMVTVTVLTLVGLINGASVYTVISAIIFGVTHIFVSVAVFFNMRYAGRIQSGRGTESQVNTVVYGAVALIYIFGILFFGYFGQGNADYTRNAVFTLDEESDTYIVTDVLAGRGGRVVIPDEYNGKRVSAIKCSILEDETIETIDLECGGDVVFIPSDAMSYSKAVIRIDKNEIDALKKSLYLQSKEDLRLIAFANAIVASGLSEDEVCITFAYTPKSIQLADYEPIPTWIGKSGDVFDLGIHAGSIDYAADYDICSEEFLYKAYLDGKMVVSPLKGADGKLLDGERITQNHAGVAVDFEDVYRVKISEDNDTKYDISSDFLSYGTTGYRYVVKSDPTDLLSRLPKREGFTVSWFYSFVEDDEVFPVTNLSDILSGGNDAVLYPAWTLNAPVIDSLTTNSVGNIFTYGDDINITGAVSAPSPDISLRYEWYVKESEDTFVLLDSSENTYSIPRALPSQSGEYLLSVTAYSDEVTSLTSVSSKHIMLTVNKKIISFDWSLPTDTVYGGKEKRILVTPFVADIIVGDTLEDKNGFDIYVNGKIGNSVIDAGEYLITISLSDTMSALYSIKGGNESRRLSISPYELTVSWTNLSFTYNAAVQCPTASAYGVGRESSRKIDLTVYGGQKNAQENIVATAVSNESNYVVKNKIQNYTIEPYLLGIAWSSDRTFLYDAKAHQVKAYLGGVIGGDSVNVVYSDWSANKNAGSYRIFASLDNSNYSLDKNASYCDYEITPAPLSLVWPDSPSLVYNGAAQRISAAPVGVVEGDVLELIYSDWSKNKNVGTYGISVSIDNKNYTLPANISSSYEITPKTLTLHWTEEITYSGVAQKSPVRIEGIAGSDTVILKYTDWSMNKNVGTYSISASLDDKNYVLTNTDCIYRIVKAPLTAEWTGLSPVYSGIAQRPTLLLSGLQNGEEIDIIYSDWSMNKNVGSYSISANITDANYYITNPSAMATDYTVKKMTLTLTWNTGKLVYNGVAQKPSLEVSGQQNGEDVKITYTDWSGSINVGNYTVGVSISDENYALPANSTFAYRIEPILLDIAWDSNAELPYNGLPQKVGASVTGALPGEDVGLVYSDWSQNLNVGNYTVTISVNNPNYTLPANSSKAYRITPIMLSIAWDNINELVYNSAPQKIGATVSGTVNGESVSLVYSPWSNNKNVGRYTVSVSINNSNYYLSENNSAEYKIVPKELSLSWESTSLVYNGKPQAPTAILSGMINGEDPRLAYGDYSTHINVGGYTVTVSLENGNYKLPENDTCVYEIIPKELTVSWSNTSLTYNGKAQAPTAILHGVENGESITPVYSNYSSNVTVGSYTVSVSINNRNYVISGVSALTYSIEAKQLNINWTNTDLTYNGKSQSPSAALVGIENGERVEITYSDVTLHVNAGSYTVFVSITDENYRLPADVSCEYKISPKPLEITWSNTDLIYNGEAQRPTAHISGVIDGETVEPIYSPWQSFINAGEYTVLISIDNTNYSLPANLYCNFEIAPKPLSVEWIGDGFVYDGNAHRPLALLLGAVKGESASPVYSDWSQNVNAGSYTVSVVPSDPNYTVTENFTRTYNILPVSITLVWDTDTELDYTGAAQDFEIKGLEGVDASFKEKIKYTYYFGTEKLDSAPLDVGEYKVVAEISDTNYSITNPSATFSIVGAKSRNGGGV